MAPIPRTWNDRVIWLLERLIGLQPGNTGTAIPLGAPASPVLHRVRVASVAGGPLTEIAIQLPDTTRHWSVVGFSFVRSSGSALTMQPTVGEVAGWSVGGLDERITYESQPVATPIRDVFCDPIPVRTDPAWRLYLRPGWSAANDNAGTVELWLVQAFATEGSN